MRALGEKIECEAIKGLPHHQSEPLMNGRWTVPSAVHKSRNCAIEREELLTLSPLLGLTNALETKER